MGGNVWLYALGLIVIIILVNLVLVAMLRGGQTHKQIGVARNIINNMRNPYRKEDEMLNELSKRVADLKNTEENTEKKDVGD